MAFIKSLVYSHLLHLRLSNKPPQVLGYLQNSANTRTELDYSRHKLEWSQFELVVSLVKVALLCNVDSSVSPIVLCLTVSVYIR
jgi:hypothetical protein